jgi:hypothetical protein
MPDYRLYCLDREGKISFAENIAARSDEEALRKAHDMKLHALRCEVWEGRRLVGALDVTDLAN